MINTSHQNQKNEIDIYYTYINILYIDLKVIKKEQLNMK